MLKFFKRSHNNDDLLTSQLYNEHQFYGEFSWDIKKATNSVIIESPYITARRAREFINLLAKARRSLAVEIYTRNPFHHDGVLVDESLRGIKTLQDAGVKVITCDDMRHRKLAIIDGRILWEGSLNMLSQNGSKEIMRRTSSKILCKQMEQFLGLRWYSRS